MFCFCLLLTWIIIQSDKVLTAAQRFFSLWFDMTLKSSTRMIIMTPYWEEKVKRDLIKCTLKQVCAREWWWCSHFWARQWVCAGQSSSDKPLGGLSKETEEIKVGNSHQNLPNQEKCRQEPPCEGTEGNRGEGGVCESYAERWRQTER